MKTGRIFVKFNGEVIGSVLTNHNMTAEEICDFAGVELAITQEDFEGMPENGKYDLNELEFEEEESYNYDGVRWGSLTEEEQEELLADANAVDGRTGDNFKGSGECIIDLTHPWSVAGRVDRGEEDVYTIDDNAIIYGHFE